MSEEMKAKMKDAAIVGAVTFIAVTAAILVAQKIG